MSADRDAAMPAPLRAWLDSVRTVGRPPGFRLTSTNAREAFHNLTRTFVTTSPQVALVQDDLIAGPAYPVPVRIYHPAPNTPLPVALFLHGGGHVSGGGALYDPIARKLALATRHVLVAADYRLAPECPYPAGLQDAMAAAKGVFRVLDQLGLVHTRRLALIGDSGGGALAATLAHRAQFEPGLTIERLALIYPSLDYSLSQPSVVENGEGYLLEIDRILWMFDAYLQHAEDRRAVSPLFMDLTADFPPTLMVTAGLCPLRDEGLAYAARLRGAGIPCETLHLPGLVHAFLNLEDLVPEVCQVTYARLGRFLAGDAPGALGSAAPAEPAKVE